MKRYPSVAARRGNSRVLVLSSSLLIDRMLVHTDFLHTLREAGIDVDVWASSAQNVTYRGLWDVQPASVRPLPEVQPFRQLFHNYPRRFNEALWDLRQRDPSRMSMLRHRPVTPETRRLWLIDRLASVLAPLGIERSVENALEHWLMRYERSDQATKLLSENRPDIVLTTGPYQFEQPGIMASALRLGIKTIALIPSWDNISTKKRMLFKYDGYIVWSHKLRDELLERYPHTRDRPVYVVGAPQFDVFFQARFQQTRSEFCAAQGLSPVRPLIVYAVGSPNFLTGEPSGALAMARSVDRGDLGDVQLLVRPHPIHDHGKLAQLFEGFSDRVKVQETSVPGTPLTARSQDEDQIREWVNTFRHAAVVVNLSSTVSVDAAICDRPVVNLDFDPAPGAPDQQLIKEINREWTHFSPIAQSGGVWLVNSITEMVDAVRTYLVQPELHREGRRWIVRHVCEYSDGDCGVRMADALRAFLDSRKVESSQRV